MKIVLQKVLTCSLFIDNKKTTSIDSGLLIFVGVHRDDNEQIVDYLAKKISTLRVFKDQNNKTNLNILDVNQEVLVVSNFTLQAELKSGTRPSFSNGSDEIKAEKLYLLLAEKLKNYGIKNVQTGKFKKDMRIEPVLDGPFTLILEK